jgi:tetratricopeptide (TPR) repeat protein
MISERLNIFFGKVEKGLSGVKTEDIAKFAAKEVVGAIPIFGQIIKDALDEFSPDAKEELIKEMKELSETQFKEISENIGVSIEYLEAIQKFTLYTFKELRADHDEIKKLLFHLIETAKRSVFKAQGGGSLKIGDTSGRIIVGENNKQYEDCTFIRLDGSTMHGKSWIYTEDIRPTTDPANIFGRRQELEEIDEILKHSQALAITGFRGTGKSTLASMYIDRIEKRGEFAGIYWREVDETIDISDVVGSFFTCVGKHIENPGRYKVGDLVSLFFRELNAAPYFLVLDNFEILLDPRTNQPLKPGFSDLIEKANEGFGRSRVLFTSWECPTSERGIRPTYHTTGGLDDSAAMQLLRRRGLTESDHELKKAIKLSGGHPLALILLVQLVEAGEVTLLDILSDDTLWQGEVAVNILDKVYKERLNEEERKLLQYVSLYRMPVPARAIATAANDPDWTEAKVKKTATSLKRKSMLEKTGKNYWDESLINNYAYNKLVDRVERHKLACQYYLSLPRPEKRTKNDDVQPLIEAHHHACMAEEYDKAVGIISDHHLYEDLDRWGNYRTLVELCAGVLPKDHFRDEPLIDRMTHGAVLGNLGLAYRNLGQVEEAIKYYEYGLAISRDLGDRYNEGNHLGNLGTAYSDLGQVEEAIKYYEDALVISKEIGDRRGEGSDLGNLGNAYHHSGKIERAIECYNDAMLISKEIGDRRGEGSDLGNLGLAYSDLGQVERAIECYNDAMLISKEIGDRRGEGNHLGNLGNAYHYHGKIERAIECYKDALLISKEIGDMRGEGVDLGNIGGAYYTLGQVDKAIKYYEDALVISKEIGDRRNEGTWLENLGLAYYTLGQVDKAIKYYEDALAIGIEIKDPRIIDFCEKNLESLKNPGN